jgi:hypothetical protein
MKSATPWQEDERKLRLLEWLLCLPSERKPPTKAGIAEELGVAPKTLRDWQGDAGFRAEWRKRAVEVAGPPERTQLVLETLFQAATDQEAPNVKAAEAWLRATASLAPQVETKADKEYALRDMSLEELQALAALAARDELKERRERAS